jgi:hypothetical protein
VTKLTAKERRARFPWAQLRGAGLSLWLDPGNCEWLRVDWTRGENRETRTLRLELTQLSEFLPALIARYNALVEEANLRTDVKIATLKPVKEDQ